MFQLLQNVQLVDMNQWVIEVSKESTRGKKKQCSLLDAGLLFFHQAYLQVFSTRSFSTRSAAVSQDLGPSVSIVVAHSS
jgi:hypothetical protein